MKNCLAVLLTLLLFSCHLSGQTAELKGTVYSGGKPVPFATIGIEGLSRGTHAGMNGIFQLEKIPPGRHSLVITAVGYRSFHKPVEIAEGSTIDLGTIELREDILGLEEVVVTGTMKETYVKDSPVKVNVITGRFLEANRAPVNITESASLINGVEEVVECGVCGTNSLRINGLEGPYTAVLIDGTPMFGNLASVYGLNGIPASLIDRIEVIKGPSSTLYGSEAVAGVLNVITKDPTRQPLLSADIRSTTHGEVFGNIGLAPVLGKWNGLVGADYAYVNDFHDAVADGFGDIVATDRISVFTKWTRQQKEDKEFSIAAKYLYEDRRNGLQDYLQDRAYRTLRGSDQVYGESIYTHRLELFGTYQLPGSENLRVDYSFSHHDQDSYYGADHYTASQQIAFANFVWDKTWKDHTFIAGNTWRYQLYDDNTVATQHNGRNQPSRQFIPGVFLQNEYAPSNHFSILGGIRLDHYENHGLIPAPRLNVKYKPGDWSTFRLNFGTGFRIVNLFTEDHAFITGQREVVVEEALSPERSWNLSLNFNHVHNLFGGQGSLDVDAFYTFFNNKIIPDYDTPGQIRYANSDGHAISKGISLSFAQSLIFPLSFTLGLTLQEVTETERDERGDFHTSPIEFAPDFTSTGTLNYRFKKAGLTAAWSFNLTGPMRLPEVFDLDEQGQPLSYSRPTRSNTWSRHTFQLTKTFKNKEFELYGGIENVFNARQPVSPLSGINDPNARPGFSDHFDTVYSYAPLVGREVYLGVRWKMGRK